MPIPNFQSIMLPLLKYTSDQKEHNMRDAETYIVNYFKVSEAESKQKTPSGLQRTIYNRVHWAKTYMVRAVLLVVPRRGAFQITQRGLDVLKTEPKEVDIQYLLQFPEFMNFKKQKNQDAELYQNDKINAEIVAIQEISRKILTPEETLDYSYQQIRENLSQEILVAIKEASPEFFEKLSVELLVKLGYGGTLTDAGKAIGKSGDEGIDGIIKEDKLGLDVIYIQAKRWEGVVGRPEIQGFVGALVAKRANKGVFITTSSFTHDAKTYVESIPQKVVLIDGEMLAQLMIDHDIGVSKIVGYDLKMIDSDYFIEE